MSSIKNNAMIPFHDLPPDELILKLQIVKQKVTLDEDEAALFLNLIMNAIRALRYKRKISYHKYGARVQFEMKDLQAYKDNNRVPSFNARIATVIA